MLTLKNYTMFKLKVINLFSSFNNSINQAKSNNFGKINPAYNLTNQFFRHKKKNTSLNHY